jgi:hypothetical protein
MSNLTHNSFLFFYMFISTLYVSSNLVLIIRRISCINTTPDMCHCVWPSSMQVGKELPYLHTRRSSTQSDTYQMYWYNLFSWWWVRRSSKHVENWNKHIEKKLCVKLVIYRNYTEMAARSTEHKHLITTLVLYSYLRVYIPYYYIMFNILNICGICACVDCYIAFVCRTGTHQTRRYR